VIGIGIVIGPVPAPLAIGVRAVDIRSFGWRFLGFNRLFFACLFLKSG
jgi:hypothetical protein